MSTPEEDVAREKLEAEKKEGLKQFFALQANNRRTEEEEKKYQQLLNQYAKDILKNPNLIKEVTGKEEVKFALEGVRKEILDQMIKDYEKTPGRKIEERDGKPCFTFNNQEEAVAFFEEQAKQGRPFQAYCKETDHCVYSDGTNFVHGTLKEVEAYKKNPEAFDLGEHGALKAKAPQEEEQQESAMRLQ